MTTGEINAAPPSPGGESAAVRDGAATAATQAAQQAANDAAAQEGEGEGEGEGAADGDGQAADGAAGDGPLADAGPPADLTGGDEGGGGEVLIGGTGGGSNLLGLSGPSGGPSSSPPPALPTPEVPPPVAEAADPPSISITGVTVNESAGVATFTLTRLSGSGDAIVSVSTSDGTATAGGDYVAFSGNLTLSASATTVTFDVTLLNDFIIESDETFSATITAEQNATVSGGTATATISNDDSSLAIAETTAGSENPGSGTFTVTRTGFLDSTVTVQFSTADGNAIAGSDYTAASGTLTFGAGVSTQTITVPVLADQLFEGTERFTVSLGTVTGEVSTATSSVQARIVNDVSIRQDIFPLEQVNGGNGYVFNGITASDQSGRSVSFVGDVNNDGAQDFAIGAHLTDTNGADIIVGAPNANANDGATYVVFGGNTALSATDNLGNPRRRHQRLQAPWQQRRTVGVCS